MASKNKISKNKMIEIKDTLFDSEDLDYSLKFLPESTKEKQVHVKAQKKRYLEYFADEMLWTDVQICKMMNIDGRRELYLWKTSDKLFMKEIEAIKTYRDSFRQQVNNDFKEKIHRTSLERISEMLVEIKPEERKLKSVVQLLADSTKFYSNNKENEKIDTRNLSVNVGIDGQVKGLSDEELEKELKKYD